jgi:lipopolysaccharide assembly protein B
MELDLAWVVLGLSVAFALGWVASRMDLRQLRLQNREDPKAYFRGLNFLLNEQEDEAIDAFVQAVQNDPDTTELHFALGNLFRRRGEYGRAVRVHEHLVARADVSRADHERALHALSQDYLRAGLLDRAEEALRQLDGTRYEAQARRARLVICERSRQWHQAEQLASQLAEHEEVGQHLSSRRAHYWCELAQQAPGPQERLSCLTEALAIAPESLRPQLALADHWYAEGRPQQALDVLLPIVQSQPDTAGLLAQRLQMWARELGDAAVVRVRECLSMAYAVSPTVDGLQALAGLEVSVEQARQRYIDHLQKTPSLLVAARWMEDEKLEHEEFHPQVQRALERAVGPLNRYRCGACGFEAQQYFWQCPGCQAWDSYAYKRVEELG